MLALGNPLTSSSAATGPRGKGWFFNFGGGAPGGGGSSGGFGFGGGGASGGFNFTAGQGSSRSISSTSGSITSLNGTPGYLFHGTLTPFVTQIRPVVGERPVTISPLQLKLQSIGGPQGLRTPLRGNDATPVSSNQNSSHAAPGSGGGRSSADHGDLSVAEIRRLQAGEGDVLENDLNRLTAEADRLESDGDLRGAALCFSKAAAKVEGARRESFLAKARRAAPEVMRITNSMEIAAMAHLVSVGLAQSFVSRYSSGAARCG